MIRLMRWLDILVVSASAINMKADAQYVSLSILRDTWNSKDWGLPNNCVIKLQWTGHRSVHGVAGLSSLARFVLRVRADLQCDQCFTPFNPTLRGKP